ncbi:MAG: inositol monophosphatase family protein, partial [Chlamydiota bacterium]
MGDRPQFLPAMTEIAREAGALLMGYFHRRVKVEYKGDVDLVTEADRASEALITRRIREGWPGHNILGEEGTRTEQGSEYRWYVDPLDGTTNFAHGFPVFCVSLALEHKDERVAAAVFDPTRNEMFTAEKGGSAFLNGQPIHASGVSKLGECLVATGFPSHKRHKNPNIFFYHQITLKTHGVRRAGSAALDLCDVACGRFEGFWEFNVNPWDTAAGVLIVEEAGGRVTRFDGQPFRIDSRETLASNGL